MENVNDIFAEFTACFAGTLDDLHNGQIHRPLSQVNNGQD